MNTVNKARLRSTIAAIIAALVAFGPDIAELITVTDSSPKWLKLVTQLLGVAIALATNGKAVAMLNKFLPADTTPEAPPQSKGPDMKSIASILVIFAALSITSCKTTPNTPDTFYQRVVTCTQENSHNTQAGAAVLNCLTGAVAGDYGACLSGLVAAGYWTVDEIACLVRGYATNAATRINAGTPQDTDSVVLERANDWIRANQLRFRSQ